jgi:hypothetical protein
MRSAEGAGLTAGALPGGLHTDHVVGRAAAGLPAGLPA